MVSEQLGRRGRWPGVVGSTLVAVAAALVGAAPAAAVGGGGDLSCLADATGGLFTSAARITRSQQLTISWSVRAGCPIAAHVSGLEFDPSEALPASGHRLMAPSLVGSYTWKLDVTATRSGLTEEFDTQTVNVVPVNFSAANAVFQAPDGAPKVVSANGVAGLNGPAMAAGTSPSMVPAMDGAGFQVAYQSADHFLWTVSQFGVPTNTGLGMMPGTSPAMALTSNGFEVAFQSGTGELWTYRSGGAGLSTGLPMAAGTSPSVALAPSGVVTVAAQGSDHVVWTVGATGVPASSGRSMAAGTNPTIVDVPFPDGYEVAYHGADGRLHWLSSDGSDAAPGVWMAPGTSPGAALHNGAVIAVVEGADQFVWSAGVSTVDRLPYQVTSDNSPAGTTLPSGLAEFVWDKGGGALWTLAFTANSFGADLTDQVMAPGTMAAITSIPNRI